VKKGCRIVEYSTSKGRINSIEYRIDIKIIRFDLIRQIFDKYELFDHSIGALSTSSRSISQGVLTRILCPNYSTKAIGNVICAARKFEALNLSGQKTWNPLVKVRRQMKDRTVYVAYGWSSVLYGRVWKSLWCSNAARKRR
jgi:hypothetical protein